MTAARITLRSLLGLLAACAAGPEADDAGAARVEFAGTSQLAFRLRRVIEDPLIEYARDPAREAPLFDATLDLQDHFVSLGFPEATVGYRVLPGERTTVVFTVEEGPRVTVAALRIAGNTAFGDDELVALWPRVRSGLLGTGDPWFVEEDLRLLRAAITEFYDARGYLDVRVVGPSIDLPRGGTRARVRFDVVEGTRYRLADVRIEGLPLTAAQLGAGAMADRPVVRAELEALRLRARSLLQERGHPEPRVDLHLDVDRDRHTVLARLTGTGGPRAQVVGVQVQGHERTAEHVLAREVRIEPGTWYDGRQVEATVRGLYGTGLFSHVDVERSALDATDEQIALTVRVREVEAREVDFLAGYGSYETLRGGVFYSDRNLFGLGQRLQLGARASLKGQGVSATWMEPRLFGSETSLTVGGHAREREEPTFVDVTRGLDVALARDLGSHLRGRVGYSLQARDGRDIDFAAGGTADAAFEIGSVFAELIHDRRDSPLYPSRGYRLSVKGEHAQDVLGGSVNLDRVTWAAAGFVELAPDWVLGLGARAGVIWPHDARGIPVQERFYNGGESSVRSFRESHLGPVSATGTPTGGAFFDTFNVELRFPLLRTLHGAVFADAGNVGLDPDDYDLRDLRWGLGGGLRLVLPIGPVRLDGAVNPDRRPAEETWVLHFSVGLPF